MIDIIKTKFKLLIRQPASFIIITVIICAFAYVLGQGSQSKLQIAVFSELNEQQTSTYMNELHNIPETAFTLYKSDEAITLVEDGEYEVAVHLMEDGFELVISPDFKDAPLINHELTTIYSKLKQKEAIISATPINEQENVGHIIEEAAAHPSFHINYSSFSNDGAFIWDSRLHSLFGFSLFMVIYTVANGVYPIILERKNHIWNRLTVSAIGKTEIYIANILYSFLIGYLQVVLVLSIFHFVVGVDFYGGFYKSVLLMIPYLLCIVSLIIFIASIANTPGKFNAIISVIAVPFAMLGGAYWPLEVVTSEVILALSYISPITYGLELLNGVTIYNSPIDDLLLPFGVLLFMSVVLMGVGINVMERRQQ
ncbi:ABC transporter permease [Lysinibacillus sp. SGAir0095]|uniref:ABC transporter permease n=1 Tax=Lysinibacillus sp. SGAir0095 TaxID=2070463 RepID=UPI0010CD5635|nr:ABC transporter permease [Lysinibacillus sp. SGAir0095]QCR32871.1 ABC transporter permease [Lysinibacillus sp. SGAir0095]